MQTGNCNEYLSYNMRMEVQPKRRQWLDGNRTKKNSDKNDDDDHDARWWCSEIPIQQAIEREKMKTI